MRNAAKYLSLMGVVLVALALLDMGILAYLIFATRGDQTSVSPEKISKGIVQKDGSYEMSDEVRRELRERNAFLFLIGDTGEVLWSFNRPEDIPESFSLADVAAFSRWYLKDYPVYTWRRDEGILVIGFPKNMVWKYQVEIKSSTLEAYAAAMPYLVGGNLLIVLILPFWLTRRWQKKREKLRTEWIAGVSHDIRTPLSIVMGNAGKGSIIEKQCLKIRSLVGNLNTENKLETGMGKWEEKKIRLAALIREIVCEYLNLEEDKYSFDFELEENLEEAVILADEGLIRRMMDNLISNSLYHNEAGCDILISVSLAGKKRISLKIADNGCGVPVDALRRLNGRISREYLPEHGLGIRVVKQIAKKYGYRIIFRSEEGKGFESEIIFRTTT